MMVDLRENPPSEIAGQKVIITEDYQSSKRVNKELDKTENIDLPKSNVLIFYLADGSKIAARPSGTEPKIKFYISVKTDLDRVENYQARQKELFDKIDRILSDLGME